jgi:hypothetical protein
MMSTSKATPGSPAQHNKELIMFTTIRNAAVAAVISTSVLALGGAVTQASAAGYASASATCNGSQNIAVSAYIMGRNGNDHAAARAVVYRWANGKWSLYSTTAWQVKQAPGMGVPFEFDNGQNPAGVPVAPSIHLNDSGYFYVGVQSYHWTGTAWGYGETSWVTSYAGGYNANYCQVA